MNELNQNDSPQQVPSMRSYFLELIINIAIPVVILSYFSKPEYLGIKIALVVALAFPVIYGCKDFVKDHKVNFFSILGVVTLLLTGGMGLLEIDPKYIAIKEAAVPGVIGLLILFSIKTKYPLIKTLVLKNPFFQYEKVERALEANNAQSAFEKTLQTSSYIFSASFFLSACTNYFLAIFVLVSPPGTEEFNKELARMIALSYPVNVLPAAVVWTFAMFYTISKIEKHTKLSFEEIFHVPGGDDKK